MFRPLTVLSYPKKAQYCTIHCKTLHRKVVELTFLLTYYEYVNTNFKFIKFITCIFYFQTPLQLLNMSCSALGSFNLKL